MRILLKCPTRDRPQKVIETLQKYVKLANHPELLGIVVSCDDSDTTMKRNLVQEELRRSVAGVFYFQIFYSGNSSKIQACNADMDKIAWEWDIVVLVSDDMIPQIKGYDDVIRNHMLSRFPDTDGILWFNDGHQEEKLNTLTIFGRKMYDRFGYLYHPQYKSLFCDTELTDLCRGELADKCLYVPYCIIRHEHPGTGYAQNMDALYERNQRFWNDDMYTYALRKKYPYDWSVLIPTIPGRETGFRALLSSIREKVSRLCPQMRVEFCVAFDNREMSIGMKRQRLLNDATGKYLSFVDDDDDVTDAYIEDVWACIQGEHHVMRLWGQMSQYKFVHSVDVKITDKMATQGPDPVFQRPPNHLNPMLSVIAKMVPFKNAVHGEDLDWTLSLYRTGFLTREYQSDASRIHYIYNLGERKVHSDVIKNQQGLTYGEMLDMIFTPAGTVAQPNEKSQKSSGLRLGPRGFVSR
jgi:hypothetical protein